MVAQKSMEKYELQGKNWHIKRKKGEFKKEFNKFSDGNTEKQRHSIFLQ